MTNHSVGHAAERHAAEYLTQHGFKLVDCNWRTRYCEIDIIAQNKKTIYFIEVKYRRTSLQGDGLDYITPKKLQQMQFAAEVWVAEHGWTGEFCLAAIEVAGERFQVTDFVTDVVL